MNFHLFFTEVTVEYIRGLPRISLPLPSRPGKCTFTLRPITQNVGEFLTMLMQEDPAVTQASITTIGNTLITYTFKFIDSTKH